MSNKKLSNLQTERKVHIKNSNEYLKTLEHSDYEWREEQESQFRKATEHTKVDIQGNNTDRKMQQKKKNKVWQTSFQTNRHVRRQSDFVLNSYREKSGKVMLKTNQFPKKPFCLKKKKLSIDIEKQTGSSGLISLAQ